MLLLALSLSGARADWRLGGETGAVYESNISNSDRTSDVRDDWAWRSNVRLSNGYQVLRDLRLTLGADLRGQVWGRFGAFNEIGAGLSAHLRYRFGLGRRAPWIALEERIGYDGFQETGRSNWDESLTLRGGIVISDRLALEAGYIFKNLAASDDFFDEQSHSANARLIVDLTSSLQIALGYSYRDGDVLSYATPSRPDIFALASERRPVTTFGSNPLYTAYRLKAQTHAVSISASYALTKYISAQVAYRYSTTSHDPLHYENHSVEARIAFAY
ncbi:MAG TPA: hypothetical protein VH207_03725 [Chthoniobacterales bacterium]|nr:hypothetical protein [Chthoniobacterales bacterium]